MTRRAAIAALATLLFAAPAGAQTVTLTNGPPNIAYAAPGSCTTSTCTWIEAGVSGEAVSDVYLDMVPMSQNYAGTFSLSGANVSNYSISTTSDGTRNVGHITTAAALSAGDDSITVSANGVSQTITVHKVSGTSSGCSEAGLSSASSSVGAGGIITIPAGCHMSLTGGWNPAANNQVLIGTGVQGYASGGTTLDGGGSICGWTSTPNNPGLAIMNLEITGVSSSTLCEAMQMGENWIVRNVYSHDNGDGISLKSCGDTIINSRINHNLYNGPAAPGGAPTATCPSNEPQQIIGTEWAQNNLSGSDVCNDVGDKWITGATYTLNIVNDYAHDNYASALWEDSEGGGSTWNISGSTFQRNSNGLVFEVSNSHKNIHNNAFIDDGNDSTIGPTTGGVNYPNCNGRASIYSHGSPNFTVIDNNFSNELGTNGQFAGAQFLIADDDGRGSGETDDNIIMGEPGHANSITFRTAGVVGGAFNNLAQNKVGTLYAANNSYPSSGSAFNYNNYHLAYSGAAAGDNHYSWFSASGWGDFNNLAGFRSIYGQEANGTVDFTDNTASGCTHVACSGAGIGPGGVPISGPCP